LVEQLGGGSGAVPAGDDQAILAELIAMSGDAVPALVRGLKFPAGFADKRALICQALGRIGSDAAAPALAATLRDPVIAVAAWACWALEGVRDEATLPALRRYQSRLLSLANAGRLPASVGPVDQLLAQVSRTRLLLGDESARQELVNLLLSHEAAARHAAIGALQQYYGDRRGYDPDAEPAERRRSALRWME
jgi:HEAT repeat protein